MSEGLCWRTLKIKQIYLINVTQGFLVKTSGSNMSVEVLVLVAVILKSLNLNKDL